MTDVLIVEHPPPMLRILRQSLLRQPGVRIVGEAGALDAALALAAPGCGPRCSHTLMLFFISIIISAWVEDVNRRPQLPAKSASR